MTPAHALRASLIFLDGFIDRGAAVDVHAAHRRLAARLGAPGGDPTVDDPIAGAGAGRLDERSAYDLLRAWLAEQRGRSATPGAVHPDLDELVRWMGWDDDAAGEPRTVDPAQWDDWSRAVAAAAED